MDLVKITNLSSNPREFICLTVEDWYTILHLAEKLGWKQIERRDEWDSWMTDHYSTQDEEKLDFFRDNPYRRLSAEDIQALSYTLKAFIQFSISEVGRTVLMSLIDRLGECSGSQSDEETDFFCRIYDEPSTLDELVTFTRERERRILLWIAETLAGQCHFRYWLSPRITDDELTEDDNFDRVYIDPECVNIFNLLADASDIERIKHPSDWPSENFENGDNDFVMYDNAIDDTHDGPAASGPPDNKEPGYFNPDDIPF